MLEKMLYMNGAWVPCASGDFIEVENPATNEILAKVPRGGQADVNQAVAAAKAAFQSWQFSPLSTRITLMEKVLQYLKEHYQELIDTVTAELGSPRKISQTLHIDPNLEEMEAFIELAKNFPYEQNRPNFVVRHEPVGIVGALTPWNFPFNQIEKKVVPALLAGNCVVLKPSQLTPLTAYILTEAIHAAGYPKGVFNLVTGAGSEVGNAIASHPDIDMVSFTGSTPAGREVARLGADTIKRIALELGGKSAALVLPGADFHLAVKVVLDTVFINAGQTCDALTRLLVPRQDLAAIEKVILEQSANYVFGPTEEPKTIVGTLASKKQYEKVKAYIELGLAEGARMILGEVPNGSPKGYYIKPTVFSDVLPSMRISQEEIFGPVLVVTVYDTIEEGLALANDSIYGLGGAVFGPTEQAEEIARKMRTGNVFVNDYQWDVRGPFGGFKQSGIGREGGVEGFEEYFELKTIFTKTPAK